MARKQRRWFGKTRTNPEIKSLNIPISDTMADFVRFGSSTSRAATPRSAISLYEKSSAVSVPVNYIAGAFAAINPVIKLPDATIIREHDVLSLLANPSPDFTRELFMETLARNRSITGEAYVAALGSVTRPPVELIPVSPQDVEPVPQGNGFVGHFSLGGELLPGSYQRMREVTGVRFIRDRFTELKQIRNFSSKNSSMLRGQSPLLAASSEIRQHILGVHHNTRLLENGGRMSLIISFDADMKQEDYDQTKEDIRKEFGGADNTGKILIASGGAMDVKEAGMSNRDMDYATLQDHARMAVASGYRFPLVLIFIDAASYNNYETAKLALYDDAVLPLCGELYGGLTDYLFPRYPSLPLGARLGVDEQEITTLVSRRLDELVKRRAVNAETDNEIRAMMGRDDIEGGDTVRDNASKIPIGTDFLGTSDNELLAERTGDR